MTTPSPKGDGSLAARFMEESMTQKERIEFDKWAWRRLTTMVAAGREDLRNLRNRFGMSVQGRLIHASAITDKERAQAEKIIRKD